MSAQLSFISLDKLSINPLRPRQTITQDSLGQLTDSIRKYGILTPLLVKENNPERYQIISGERRYRAAKVAGLDEVPCMIVEAEVEQTLLFSLAENLQREPLNLIEQALIVTKLEENHAVSLLEIGESTGLPLGHLEKLLKILELPEKIRRAYVERKLANEAILQLVEIDDPVEQEVVFEEMLVE